MTVKLDTTSEHNNVGPIMRSGELARVVAEAAEVDNPGKMISVDDKLAYVRISAEDEMIIRRDTIEELLGRPFHMREIEVDLSSFSGSIEMTNDFLRFYFKTHL
jgi:toluene monooxygenase system protein D